MSFRGRLRLFFALIVVVPMVALGIVLFVLTGQTETGKADAGIAAGTRAAMGIYGEQAEQARASVRRLIALEVGLFVLLALISAGFVSRALTGQIATFLAAARRLSRGDFQQLVPLHGNDEFAELGREFNDMSVQLEAKMEEVEHKRQELAETIRRVGDALATGLDRHGVVALAVRQAVDACDAEVGRALPLVRGGFAGCEVGEVSGEFKRAIETAERDVFAIRSDVGAE